MELLTAAETAKLLKVGTERVYALVREGLLPAIHLGRHLRFDAVALKAWCDKGGKSYEGSGRRGSK